jgi:MoxR-like ATPase
MVEIDRPAILAMCALLAEGHLLIEDVPGVGKTTLARIIARAIGGHDSRVQCTADLDARAVIGYEVEQSGGLREPEFVPGPIFANAVVFDEFNRATPKLQSALFEAMEEKVVTLGKRRHKLPRPFFGIATINPHDNEGTFEMPHPSRDRFAVRTGIGYASEEGERSLISRFGGWRVPEIDPIVAPGDIVKLQRAVSLVHAQEHISVYLVRLMRATRTHDSVLVGASPRALLSTFRCVQAKAMLDNLTEVSIEHVQEMFVPCVAHRLRVKPTVTDSAVCDEILATVPVPAPKKAPKLRPVEDEPAVDEMGRFAF